MDLVKKMWSNGIRLREDQCDNILLMQQSDNDSKVRTSCNNVSPGGPIQSKLTNIKNSHLRCRIDMTTTSRSNMQISSSITTTTTRPHNGSGTAGTGKTKFRMKRRMDVHYLFLINVAEELLHKNYNDTLLRPGVLLRIMRTSLRGSHDFKP